MRRTLTALIGAVALVAVAACSEDESDEPASADTTDDSTTELPDENELRKGLLTIGDMPTGWAEVPLDDQDEPLCGIRISRLLDLGRELPIAEVQFAEDAERGPAFGEYLGFVPAGRGPDVIPAMQSAYDDCDGETRDGKEVTIADLSFRDLGDDSAAYRMNFEDLDTGQTASMDAVYVQVGDMILVCFAYDVFGDSTEVLAEYAPRAVHLATRIT